MRLGGGKYATTGLRAGQSLTRRNDAGAAVFKRITLVCLAACLTALPAFAAETQVRVVGVELPPLIMSTPYGSTGIIVDIVKTAFRRANLKVDIAIEPWARAYASVRDGEGDALIPTIRSTEREALFDFPDEPVFKSEMSFFRSSRKPIAWSGKLADVQTRRFVKLRAALFAPEFDAAVREGRIACEETNSFASAIRMVDADRVDLAAVPKLAGLQIIAAEGLQGRVAALDPAFYVQNFFIAFSRKNALASQRQKVDSQLAAMWKDGTIAAIIDDYRKRNWLPASTSEALPH